MKYFFGLTLGIFATILMVDIAFADFTEYRPSKSEVISAAESCIKDGVPLDERYTCPIGNFQGTSAQTLTREKIECSIQMSLAFYKIDEESKIWTKQLQSSREKEFNVWNQNIGTTLYKKDGFLEKYRSVCAIQNWTQWELGEIGCAKTTDFFPETTCHDLAKKKTESLENIWYILASKGTGKAYQNEKDTYLDTQKTKYDVLIDKWNSYLRMVSISVQKFTKFIAEAVK